MQNVVEKNKKIDTSETRHFVVCKTMVTKQRTQNIKTKIQLNNKNKRIEATVFHGRKYTKLHGLRVTNYDTTETS